MTEANDFKRAHKLTTQFKGNSEPWRAYRYELGNEVGATSPQLMAYLSSMVNLDHVVYTSEIKADLADIEKRILRSTPLLVRRISR